MKGRPAYLASRQYILGETLNLRKERILLCSKLGSRAKIG
jgi:hypothetical protein